MTFQVNLTEQTPQPNEGSNPKNGFGKVAEQPVVRSVPGLNTYNPQTGQHEPAVEWKDKVAPKKKEAKETTTTVVEEKKEGTETVDAKTRHQTWKEQQAAKKESKQQAQVAKQVAQQALAKDYLKQGNIVKAAEALGMTTTEFLALSQNAALSIATKDKELTPEEKKAQDEANYRQKVDAQLEEDRRFRFETTANNWTRENIAPVMADVEKYQLLNQDKSKVPQIQRAVYDYLNQHYQETCEYDSKGQLVKDGETLNVSDVLDTMEAQFEAAAQQSINNFKGIKKFAKYFTAEELQEQQDKEAQRSVSVKSAPGKKKGPQFPPPAEEVELPQTELAAQDEEEPQLGEEEEETNDDTAPRFSVSPKGTAKNLPFALMSSEQKIAYFRSLNKKK